jgi:hypothetical protein
MYLRKEKNLVKRAAIYIVTDQNKSVYSIVLDWINISITESMPAGHHWICRALALQYGSITLIPSRKAFCFSAARSQPRARETFSGIRGRGSTGFSRTGKSSTQPDAKDVWSPSNYGLLWYMNAIPPLLVQSYFLIPLLAMQSLRRAQKDFNWRTCSRSINRNGNTQRTWYQFLRTQAPKHECHDMGCNPRKLLK